jgi:hypothetical protein
MYIFELDQENIGYIRGAVWFGLSPGWKQDRSQLVQFSDGGMSSDAGGGRTSTCWSFLPNIRNMLKLHPGDRKRVKPVPLDQNKMVK